MSPSRVKIATSIFLLLAISPYTSAQSSTPTTTEPAAPTQNEPNSASVTLLDLPLCNPSVAWLPVADPSPIPVSSVQVVPEKITWKKWIDANGIQPHFSLKTEGSAAVGSSISPERADGRNLVEAALDLDPGKRLGWRGALLHASLHSYAGDDGSAGLTGDAQGYSNISAQARTMLYELWLQQTIAGGKLAFQAGKMDANNSFDVIENGTYFLHSSMGHSPTLYDMPTYPLPRLGVVVSIAPTKYFYVRNGTFLNSNKGAIIFSEGGIRWRMPGLGSPGHFTYGYWVRTPTDVGLSGELISSVSGHYLVAEQILWRPAGAGEDRGLGAFFQYGNATPDASPFQQHFGGGFQWTGLAAERAGDVLGLGVSHVVLSPLARMDAQHQEECAFEGFYSIRVRSWVSFAPDVQYIDHPSASPLRPRATVATIRMTLSY